MTIAIKISFSLPERINQALKQWLVASLDNRLISPLWKGQNMVGIHCYYSSRGGGVSIIIIDYIWESINPSLSWPHLQEWTQVFLVLFITYFVRKKHSAFWSLWWVFLRKFLICEKILKTSGAIWIPITRIKHLQN